MLKNKFAKSVPSGTSGNVDLYNVLSPISPRSIAEAYRKLYANITYLPIEDKCRKLAVTSANKGEGKTTVAVNLAVTLAQNLNRSKVLLIDCDLRKPGVSLMLPTDQPRTGLCEFLAGADKEPNIVASSVDGLSVLYAGGYYDNPTRLISSERMAALIRICEERFDYMILDTTAMDASAEAMLLKKYVNGYLLVAKARNSDVASLSSAIESLHTLNATVFGVVLTGEEVKAKRKRKLFCRK
ncbi:MAG: CpsD/CapB family tyrosine-protein kinase [Clostridia bacterium]|nr:CpsD/CapB family tyrosine-protein kinase [Clostridia bacterium]